LAATVTVVEANGAGPSYNTVTSPRLCVADSYNPGLDDPIPIPSGGAGNYAYSFWKHFFLNLADSFTRINNVKFYCDGTIGWNFGTGGVLYVGVRDSGDNGCPEGSYEQAAGDGTDGYSMVDGTNGHDYYKGQSPGEANIEDYTDGSELEVDTTNHESAERTYGVVLQLKIDGDSTLGVQTDETLTWEYDEI